MRAIPAARVILPSWSPQASGLDPLGPKPRGIPPSRTTSSSSNRGPWNGDRGLAHQRWPHESAAIAGAWDRPLEPPSSAFLAGARRPRPVRHATTGARQPAWRWSLPSKNGHGAVKLPALWRLKLDQQPYPSIN
jgi:hypothetical protein